MICLNCKKIFYIKRSLRELFNTKEEILCDSCYKKYPISLEYETIALDKYSAIIISMFKKNYRIDYNVFYRETSKILQSNFNREGFFTMFIETVYFDDLGLEELDIISKLCKSNLFIICYNFKDER